MIQSGYIEEKGRFEVTVTGDYSDEEMRAATLEVLSSDKFGPGSRVLVDSSRAASSMSPRHLSMYIKMLSSVGKKLDGVCYAMVVANARGMMVGNIIRGFAAPTSIQVRAFYSYEAADRWLREVKQA